MTSVYKGKIKKGSTKASLSKQWKIPEQIVPLSYSMYHSNIRTLPKVHQRGGGYYPALQKTHTKENENIKWNLTNIISIKFNTKQNNSKW